MVKKCNNGKLGLHHLNIFIRGFVPLLYGLVGTTMKSLLIELIELQRVIQQQQQQQQERTVF